VILLREKGKRSLNRVVKLDDNVGELNFRANFKRNKMKDTESSLAQRKPASSIAEGVTGF